jgi:O-succinylhomoserine sulfhydrylase
MSTEFEKLTARMQRLGEDLPDLSLESRAVRVGQLPTNEGAHSEPIFTTSSFVYSSAEEAAARFGGTSKGNIYSRFTNPTISAFEQRLASLEGGTRGIATSSGMAAILTTCLGVLRAGDHLLCSRSVFGTTVILLNNFLAKFGVEVDYVTLSDVESWRAAMKPNTKLLFLETPANPLTEIGDMQAIADLAHAQGALVAVDNCFCTPILQRPFEFDADIIIHSATKYLDGQGRALGGAIVTKDDAIGEPIYGALRSGGASMSPFNAWIFLKGLETLSLRMKAHSENAAQIAAWLEGQSGIARVWYPGLESHPQYALAQKQMDAPGGIVSFEVEGGREAAWKLINATRMLSITAKLGDARTTIVHPATTTHGRLTDAERAEAGISDGLVRIAVGLEGVADIQADLARGLRG